MVDLETVMGSRYKKRVERMLTEYRKRCINPDDYELKVTVDDNGHAVYTLIDWHKKTVKTTVRDQIFKGKGKSRDREENAGRKKLGEAALAALSTTVDRRDSCSSVTLVDQVNAARELTNTPRSTYSRKRSSSAIYRLSLEDLSDSELTCGALDVHNDNDGAKTPAKSRLAAAQGPASYCSSPQASSVEKAAAPSHIVSHSLAFSLRILKREVKTKSHGEGDQSEEGIQLKNKDSDKSSDTKKVVRIYKERLRQLDLYGDEEHHSTSPRVRKVVPAISNVFPRAVFPPLSPGELCRQCTKSRIEKARSGQSVGRYNGLIISPCLSPERVKSTTKHCNSNNLRLHLPAK